MRIYLFVLAMAFLLAGCTREKTNFTIDVKVSGGSGEQLILARRTLDGTIPIDSARGDADTYQLKGYTNQPDFFILYFHPGSYINLIIHPKDRFAVLANADQFDLNYLVEGSKDSRLIQKLVKKQAETLGRITALSNEYEQSMNDPGFARIKGRTYSLYNLITEEHLRFSKQLIAENPGSLVSLMALYQQLGKRQPVFDPQTAFEWFERVDSALTSHYPESEAIRDLNRKVTALREARRLAPGSPAPDFSINLADGTSQSLKGLRGKKVILVFWASWSDESLSALGYLGAFQKRHAPDAVMFMVSLDRTRGSWDIGMDRAGQIGLHGCDFRYWDSPVVASYRVEKLPTFCIIDQSGNIISFGSDPALLSPNIFSQP